MVEWLVFAALWGVAAFSGGAVYGARRSIKVGMLLDRIELWYDGLVDKLSKETRRTRNKVRKAKELARIIGK